MAFSGATILESLVKNIKANKFSFLDSLKNKLKNKSLADNSRKRRGLDPVIVSVVSVSVLAYFMYSGGVDRFILWYKLASNADNALLTDPVNVSIRSLDTLAAANPVAKSNLTVQFDGVTTYLADDTKFKISLVFTDYPDCAVVIDGYMAETTGGIKEDSKAHVSCLFYERESIFGTIPLTSITTIQKPGQDNEVNSEQRNQRKYLVDAEPLPMAKMIGWNQLTSPEKIKFGRE